MSGTAHDRARRVKTLAHDCGFDLAGVAAVDPPRELQALRAWVGRGFAGEMDYLTSQVARREDLRVSFPWARSVIAVALNYDAPAPYSTEAPAERGWISRYAWGDDYHDVMRTRLRRLAERLGAELGPFEWRAYADTGPLVDRAWAAAAGLGWWGKNTCIIHPELGSWLFLGEIVTDLELAPDAPQPDRCGTCTACLDACPTHALLAPGLLDSRRCISYLTIEIKGAIPEEHRQGVGRHVFGCDICQDVCPWNRRRRPVGLPEFAPRPGLVAPDLTELAALDAAGFSQRFRRSAVKRTKRRGLLRNVAVALGNQGDARQRDWLERLAASDEPLVRPHARWALDRLGPI